MAKLLYRLGMGSARHAWAVIISWFVVLVVAVGAVALTGVQLSNAITIPGTETQRLADRLQDELPEANQGTGRMIFYTPDGSKFTQQQRDGIADALAATETVGEVDSAGNPFDTQKQLDQGRQQLAQGRQQLEQGQQALEQLQSSLPPGADPQQVLKQRGIDPQEIEQQQAQLEAGERSFDRMNDYRVVSQDDNSVIAVVNFTVDQTAVSAEAKQAVMDAVRDHSVAGVDVEFSEELAQDISSLVGPAEIIGVVIAAIVLLVMLRAIVPAVMPVLTALMGVGIATTATLALSGVIDMMSVTPMLGVMLGLAVGIDYSLFVLNRHRQQLRDGMEVRQSIGMAVGTAGTAVFFAALTVIVALVALNVTAIPFLGLMGTVAGVAVAVALLITLTLTPALLSLAGRRVLPRRLRNGGPAHRAATGDTVPLHLRHPWLTTVLGVALLIVLALPAQSMRLGLPDASTESQDSTQYQAYERIAQDFGAGENGPLAVVVDLPGDQTEAQADDTVTAVSQQISEQDDVAHVLPGVVSKDRTTGVIQVIPRSGPADEKTEQLVDNIRGLNGDLRGDANAVGVAGTTAANIDVSQLLGQKLPLYLGVVLIISLLLLLMVFRSILVPVIATVGFLLSVLASLGAVVAVYQWGWGGALLGVHDPGPILSFLPTLMIGILFGLAMDYQLFLVSGMREAYVHGLPAREAAVHGFKSGRAVVTAAAIIMISVFSGFIFADLAMIRPIGFALAIGVLLDAFVVRVFLIPALMRLLGEKAWWLPRWLDTILPHVDVEGESLVYSARREGPAAGAAAPSPSGSRGGPVTSGDGASGSPEADDKTSSRTGGASPAAAGLRPVDPTGADGGSAGSPVAATTVAAGPDGPGAAGPDAPSPAGTHPHGRHAGRPLGEVLRRPADPALRATNQALRLLPHVMGSEESLRASLAERGDEGAPLKSMHERVDFERVTVAGRSVLLVRPKEPVAGAPVVVYWHGGAYVMPVRTEHWRFLDGLIRRTGATVLVPSYGLAPEHTVDDALPLADGVLELARAQGERVFLMGDSAGGGLVLAQAQRMRDRGQGPAEGLVLISPWLDVTASNPQIAEYRDVDHMLGLPGGRAAGRWWAGARDVRDPLVSPLYGDFTGLPRTLLLQGDRDLTYPDAMVAVAELRHAGVSVTALVCEGGPHVYPLMTWSSRARADLDYIAGWLGG